MYINVDIDNNNFYFSIVLHAKLMKYMIYKNNWNHKNICTLFFLLSTIY